MKKHIIFLSSFFLILLIVACEKKESAGISPGYIENTGSTGGNPNANNPTVTGATMAINTATKNTSFNIGGNGWSNKNCGSTNSLTLNGIFGTTEVNLTFANAALNGTYTIGAMAAVGICSLKLINAPSQPEGIVWVGKSGIVSVNTSSNSIDATFTNIDCVQESFSLPKVMVSGTLSCSQ